MAEICIVCEGSGLRVVQEPTKEGGARQVARPCECRAERRAARMLERAHIPKRYEHCTLVDFDPKYAGADHTIWAAHMRARKFVEGYPVETSNMGLMFIGSVGVGKTHPVSYTHLDVYKRQPSPRRCTPSGPAQCSHPRGCVRGERQR